MSRIVDLDLEEGVVVIRCLSENVGVSKIEPLPGGGVRLECTSDEGAALIRSQLTEYLIGGSARRERQPPNNKLA